MTKFKELNRYLRKGLPELVASTDWKIVTSLSEIRKNSRISRIFFLNSYKFVQIRFITSLVTAKSSSLHNTNYSYTYIQVNVEWEQ